MTHPFDLKKPSLWTREDRIALLVDTIRGPPQQPLVCERPGYLGL